MGAALPSRKPASVGTCPNLLGPFPQVSLASRKQRRGRAGRTREGEYWALYSRAVSARSRCADASRARVARWRSEQSSVAAHAVAFALSAAW